MNLIRRKILFKKTKDLTSKKALVNCEDFKISTDTEDQILYRFLQGTAPLIEGSQINRNFSDLEQNILYRDTPRSSKSVLLTARSVCSKIPPYSVKGDINSGNSSPNYIESMSSTPCNKLSREDSFVSTFGNEVDLEKNFRNLANTKMTEYESKGADRLNEKERENVKDNDEKYGVAPKCPKQAIERRKCLPVPKSTAKFSLLSMMRQVFGKDLSRISMPICLNEPLSFIQRLAEDLEYHYLLEIASKSKSYTERMAYVTVFASTAFSSSFQRLSKPFNPILGETYELTHRGFRYIAEQVVHHPPIAAYHAESDNKDWKYWGTVWSEMSFGPNSLTIQPQGPIHLSLKTCDGIETYHWRRPKCIAHNIIFGSTWLEWVGDTIVECDQNTCIGKVSFMTDTSGIYLWSRNTDATNKRRNIVAGSVYNEENHRIYAIDGLTDSEIKLTNLKTHPENLDRTRNNNAKSESRSLIKRASLTSTTIPSILSKTVWKCNPQPNGGKNSANYYFTYMALELNEITPDYDPNCGANIPRTDSRFRPDQRLYENGDIDGAQLIKAKLEDEQRKRERTGNSAKHQWFTKGKLLTGSKFENQFSKRSSSLSGDFMEFEWNFMGEYWDIKENSSFRAVEEVDIFYLGN
ncbi:putative oxysterol-binding protein [Cryptosporidium serpentis]